MECQRVLCFLMVLFILQLHAKGFNANLHTQAMDIAPQAAYNGGIEATADIQRINKNIRNFVKIRKIMNGRTYTKMNKKKEVYPPADDEEKNGLDIESELLSGSTANHQKNLKSASLTADYSDPGHHPPRHN